MFKSKLLSGLTLFFTILGIVSIITLARTSHAEGAGDVFMDEGDGDFDAVPSAKKAPKIAAEPVHEAAPVAVPAGIADIVDTPEAPLLVDDQAAPAAKSPTDDPAAPAAAVPREKKAKKKSPKKRKAEKTAANTAANTDDAPSATGGSFVVTKEACPMMRTPASTGEPMLTVKPSKKIWVEQAGDGWVKGWSKSGEAGYIAKDCVQ